MDIKVSCPPSATSSSRLPLTWEKPRRTSPVEDDEDEDEGANGEGDEGLGEELLLMMFPETVIASKDIIDSSPTSVEVTPVKSAVCSGATTANDRLLAAAAEEEVVEEVVVVVVVATPVPSSSSIVIVI